jgi:hypothetical protein
VVVRWWRDGHGYVGVNDELAFSAGGTSYDDLRQHVAESAEREGWQLWSLLADHAGQPDEPVRRGGPRGPRGRRGPGPTRRAEDRDAPPGWRQPEPGPPS